MKKLQKVKAIRVSDVRSFLPKRHASGNKGSFGRLQIVAGSRAFPGSAHLSSLGAFKAGVGYVYLGGTASREVLRTLPELIPGLAERMDAFVYGPGIGTTKTPQRFLRAFRSVAGVVDADGLFRIPKGVAPRVLTPHPGEAAKLLDWTVKRVQADRVATVRALQKKFGAQNVVVLKGQHTLVAHGAMIQKNTTGNVAMASAGQGDVLAGIIGAFLAQGMPPFHAALAGVFLHGLAADTLSKGGMDRGVLAHEVALVFPAVLARALRRTVRGR